ncbi:MAG: hypothetical protein ABH890_07365 [Bacillota bacterium]
MKKVLSIFTIAMLVISLVGCQAQDALSVFERAASDEISLMASYEAIEETDVNNQTLDQLSFENIQQLSMTLGTDDMTNLEKIAYIRSLFEDIQIAHAQNILIRYENKDSWSALKLCVQAFRDAELTLTEDDQTILLTYKTEFSIRRLEVMETVGDIKEMLMELKGLYDLDHLDVIIQNFEAILDILEMRYDHMLFVQATLIDVNSILTSYLA